MAGRIEWTIRLADGAGCYAADTDATIEYVAGWNHLDGVILRIESITIPVRHDADPPRQCRHCDLLASSDPLFAMWGWREKLRLEADADFREAVAQAEDLGISA